MQSLSSFRKPDSFRTLGIEWELVCNYDHYLARGTYQGFFYVTTDGSIEAREGYGRELVSQPLPAKWLIKELERVNKKLNANNNWTYNSSCGIHVHASRKWVTSKKVDHLRTFLGEITPAEAHSAFGRVPNSYCRSLAGVNKENHSRYAVHDPRYYCLNITNEKTVEFRMFRSGDVKWAQYCVKLVEYMIVNSTHLNKDAFFAFVDMEQPK